MSEPLDEPLGVVAGDELADDPARLGETLEAMEVEALLGSYPAFSYMGADATERRLEVAYHQTEDGGKLSDSVHLLNLWCLDGRCSAEVLRQVGGPRQGRAGDEDGNRSLAAREGLADFPSDEIAGIVEPPLTIEALGPKPSRADHGEQRVTAAHALVQHVLPVITELDLLYVHEAVAFAEPFS